MSIEIQMPYEQLPTLGVICKHFAAHNPIEILVQRKDYTGTSSDDSGLTKITSSGFIRPDDGTYIYVNAGTVIGVYLVISTSSTIIHLDRVWGASDLGDLGFFNLNSKYPNYFIETNIDIHTLDSDSGDNDYYSTIKTRPDTTGLATIDVSPFIRDRLICENEFDYQSLPDTNSAVDENLSARFLVNHREYFDATIGYGSFSESSDVYAYNAAMQPGHSACMPEYMTEVSGQDRALFLSSVRKLRWWSGYPLSLELIISEDVVLDGVALRRLEIVKQGSTNISPNVIAYNINFPDSGNVGGLLNRIGLESNYTVPSDNVDVLIQTVDGLSITETINIRLTHCIPKNPIYLCWIDYTGGWRCFLFGTTQVRGLKTTSGGLFTNRRESDFRNSERFTDLIALVHDDEYVSKTATPELTMGADSIDLYDIQLIESLLSSPKVLMLINPDSWDDTDSSGIVTPAWETVKVDVGSYKITDTKKTLSSCQFKIILPQINLQTQ